MTPSLPGRWLSFERGPLTGGNTGLSGDLFNPANKSLITLFGHLGLGNLRIGGGTVDQLIPAGTGSDGFACIDGLFGFAAEAGVKVVYTLRMLNPAASPISGLQTINAQAAGYIWGHYRESLASFAVGNEPDWHSYHSYPGHPLDPAIYEQAPGVPGSAYPSYLAQWRSLAGAIAAAAPGAPMSGPDLGAYDQGTYTPDPATGVSWTHQLAQDEGGGGLAEVSQHYYVGGEPGATTAEQAIGNMLSAGWVTGTAVGSQPAGTAYTPYPRLYANNLAPATAAGLPYRLTESNDYLGGVPGASDAFGSALWALDHLHWFAAHGAAGVNFHNRLGLSTDTIIPDPGSPGAGYAVNPKGYGIKAFTLGSAGQVRPTQIENPGGVNLTAYCVGQPGEDYVTIINKAHGADAPDAAVTIVPAGPGVRSVEMMTLAGGQRGDARGSTVTLGGALITADTPWNGQWTALAAGPQGEISLTVQATTATIVKISSAGG